MYLSSKPQKSLGEDNPHLKCNTAHREVFPVLQHAQVLGHQGCRVHQALGGLGVVAPLGVLPCHVLQPRQPQVGGILVALGNPKGRENLCDSMPFPSEPAQPFSMVFSHHIWSLLLKTPIPLGAVWKFLRQEAVEMGSHPKLQIFDPVSGEGALDDAKALDQSPCFT